MLGARLTSSLVLRNLPLRMPSFSGRRRMSISPGGVWLALSRVAVVADLWKMKEAVGVNTDEGDWKGTGA